MKHHHKRVGIILGLSALLLSSIALGRGSQTNAPEGRAKAPAVFAYNAADYYLSSQIGSTTTFSKIPDLDAQRFDDQAGFVSLTGKLPYAKCQERKTITYGIEAHRKFKRIEANPMTKRWCSSDAKNCTVDDGFEFCRRQQFYIPQLFEHPFDLYVCGQQTLCNGGKSSVKSLTTYFNFDIFWGTVIVSN
ncbi:MAG: hypothetical protein HRU19_03190 [Pseudobacteriovorax sp.]|nr:hypothetical protein [Pseudobacteriovorax sp.]